MYDDYLEHKGVGHLHGGHSGRYPWGSGKKRKQNEAISKMSNEELIKKTNRANNESNYIQAINRRNSLSIGKRTLLSKVGNKILTGVIAAAAVEAGKNVLQNYFQQGLKKGINKAIKHNDENDSVKIGKKYIQNFLR